MVDKICNICNNTYQSGATQRKRTGKCNNCRNEGNRKKYEIKKLAEGTEVNAFKNLLSKGLKKCNSCGEVKSVLTFTTRKSTKYRSECKPCEAEKNKQYESANRDLINKKRRDRRACPTRGIIYTQRDRQRSIFKSRDIKKPAPSTVLIREWLGCSIEYCRDYIEKQFKDGMDWSNRGIGIGKWQIDHNIPISLTILSQEGTVIDCDINRQIWHYTNLQPLWHFENAQKSNKYIHDSKE